MVEALEAQAYMETVCYQCKTWPQCQGSNLEDCKRRDDEALRFKEIQGAIDGLKAQGLPEKTIKRLENWLAREKAKDN